MFFESILILLSVYRLSKDLIGVAMHYCCICQEMIIVQETFYDLNLLSGYTVCKVKYGVIHAQ